MEYCVKYNSTRYIHVCRRLIGNRLQSAVVGTHNNFNCIFKSLQFYLFFSFSADMYLDEN